MKADAEARAVCDRWALRGPAGAPVACSSKYLGREIEGPPSIGRVEVVGCAIPLRRPDRVARGSQRACEGAFRVEGEGLSRVVAKSTVRDWARARGGPCPDWMRTASPADRRGVEARAREWGVTPFEAWGAELPTPHRVGSTPCCRNSAVSFERLRDLERAAFEGGDREADELVEALRAALPVALRAEVEVDGPEDAPRVLAALSRHCLELVDRWAGRKRGRAQESSARVVGRKRARALAEGRDVTAADYRDELVKRVSGARATRFRVG